MKDIINQIHNLLIRSKRTLSVAESCTAGLLSNLLTKIPGSSSYFILGVTVYSNESKSSMLNIPSNIIAIKGAVSSNVAKLMAKSVRLKAGTYLGIGITGIAGPSGGSKDKPVGTVFIALDTRNKKICKKFKFSGSRTTIRKKAALKALEELLKFIFSEPAHS